MNIIEAIEQRRSLKHYDPQHQMPEADLAELIRLTKLAPSSFNMQNYRLVLVRDPGLRKHIRAAAGDQAQVTDASLLVVMCADQEAYRKDPARYCKGDRPGKPTRSLNGLSLPSAVRGHLITDRGRRRV